MCGERETGFSLIEMMITVALAAIVISMGVSGFRALLQNNRVVADANALVGALNLARNEAVTRGLPVSVCSTANGTTCAGVADWATGWLVFVDDAGTAGTLDGSDALVRVYPALNGSETLTASANFARFGSSGFLLSPAVTFQLRIAGCRLDHNRDISLSSEGRVASAAVACS